MLSDEEKKAIDNMKSLLLYSKEHEYFSPFQEQEIDDMNIVLNIVEKQSKEIEELEDKIKAEIEELKNMKVDGEVFTTAVNFGIKVLQSFLEKVGENNGTTEQMH